MMKKFLMTSKIHRILFFPVLTKKNMLPHTLEMSTHTLRDREKSDDDSLGSLVKEAIDRGKESDSA